MRRLILLTAIALVGLMGIWGGTSLALRNDGGEVAGLGGTYEMQINVREDVDAHQKVIQMPSSLSLDVIFEGPDVVIAGPSPWVAVSGPFADGEFIVTGTGTVAGIADVTVIFEGTVTPDGPVGNYWMGTEGLLPGGNYINYELKPPPQEQFYTITVLKRHDDTKRGLPGWEFNLYALSGCNGIFLGSGNTGADGTLEFGSLAAGAYSIEEKPQEGWNNVTPLCQDVSVPGTAGLVAGEAFPNAGPVPACPVTNDPFPEAGCDEFPSIATVKLELTNPPFGDLACDLSGPTQIVRGAVETKPPDSIDTEVVFMKLVGSCEPGSIEVTLRESPTLDSTGRIVEQTNNDPGTLEFPADSFFDIFFEVDSPIGKLHNETALRMECKISSMPPYGCFYEPDVGELQLFDVTGKKVGRLIHAAHIPIDPKKVLVVFVNAPKPPPDDKQCPDGNTVDTDGDDLLDCWEIDGMDWDGDGTIDLELYDVNGDGTIDASERADPLRKDLYVELDFMADHQPRAGAIQDVIDAFAAAPVTNPDGTTGIRLHVQVDEEALAHSDDLAFVPCTPAGTPDFDTVKSDRWGSVAERADPNAAVILKAKRWMARYSLWVHDLLGLGGTSGCAELPGNDHVVSLGSWPGDGGTRAQQAGTFMHEFGHNLDLRHGGSDNINCKPNYLSVMSYSRQVSAALPLDYSPDMLAALSEASLSEPAGISGPAGSLTRYGPAPALTVPGDLPIDWNRDSDATDTGVVGDINNMGPGSGCGAAAGQTLAGFDDWDNLAYDISNVADFADGVHLSAPSSDEITLDEAIILSDNSDDDDVVDVLDNCPLTTNADQADADGNGIGDACDAGLPPPTPTPTATPTEPPAPPTSTPTQTPAPTDRDGDVTCDGLTNSVDALFVLQYVAGLLTTLACEDSADVNGDGVIDSRDASLILQADAGFITLPL